MAAHPSHSFASPDLPGDACVILVLLESTPNMSGYWPELQSYYLPLILQALQNGTPDTPVGPPRHSAPFLALIATRYMSTGR